MNKKTTYDKRSNRLKTNAKGIVLMLVCSTCLAGGQLLWKLIEPYGIVMLFAGFVVYGAGALSMLMAYRYGELSVLQPLNSVSYVVSLILGAVLLHEDITAIKCAGVAAILLGVLLTSGGKQA
ncbi:MAG: EamA family transporter [Clostridia bacterium]